MGSRYSVPLIHTLTHFLSGAYINGIYAGSPVISSVHLVVSVDVSCISCIIPSDYCLAAVDFYRFTHSGYLPNTVCNCVNIPFSSGIPIVVWQQFPMTEQNVLKFTRPLRLIAFSDCNIYSCLSSASSMHLSDLPNIHPITSVLVYHSPLTFSNFPSDIGSGIPYVVTECGGKTFNFPWSSSFYRCKICNSNFGWYVLMKSSTKSSSSFINLLSITYLHLVMSGMVFILFVGILCFSNGCGSSVPTRALI